MWRRVAVVTLIGLAVLMAGLVVGELAGARVFARLGTLAAETRPPIVVGLLHSLSGPLEPYERPLKDAEVFALEEINASGGVGGRLVKWVEADGRSDPRVFAAQARKLIEKDGATVIFGCWTAECRKAVRPVVEELNSLLVFPGDFEGIERSPHVVYAGMSANQQVVPAVRWMIENQGAKKVFLVMSDEVWSKTAGAIAWDQIRVFGLAPPGEASLPIGSIDVAATVAAIREAKPDLVLNFAIGDTNAALFPALRRAGLAAKTTPVLSFKMSEEDAGRINPDDVDGHLIVSDYFASVDSVENRDFLRRFKLSFGDNRTPTGPSVIAYEAVALWAKAAGELYEAEEALLRLPAVSYDGPDGVVSIDRNLLAAWRPVHIGRAAGPGQFDVIWSNDRPIRPLTYTITRSNRDWDSFLDGLHAGWRGQWSGGGGPASAVPPGG